MIGRTVALALTGLGGLFMILGALLFFNQWLLKVANFMLIPGIVGLVGLDDLTVLLTRKGNRRGAFAFLAGLFLIIYGTSERKQNAPAYRERERFANVHALHHANSSVST